MKQKTLSKWLKVIFAVVGLCVLAVCLFVPYYGKQLISMYPEFSNRYWPWLIFIWGSCIPCFVVVGLSLKVAGSIEQDRSFSAENAKRLKWISWLAAGDSAYFFVGNALFFFLGMNYPSMVIFSLIIIIIGIAIALASAVLSHLIQKAADLQEQSDLTI